MPIVFVERYSREDLRNNPENLYVFGDNIRRVGLGGQAAACRGEPNAVGIPTKIGPSNGPTDFFFDAILPDLKPFFDHGFKQLEDHLTRGGIVVWPKDGIGTGLAQLPIRAPKIHEYLNQRLAELQKI